MIRILRSIDDFVFDVPKVGMQSLASLIEYFTSVRPTAVARFMFVIAVALTVWVNYQKYLAALQPMSFFWIAAWLVLGYVLVRNTYALEGVYTPGTRNRLRVSESVMTIRVIALYLTVMTVAMYFLSRDLELLNMVFVSLGSYFTSCDWLPPGERYQWRKPVTEGV